MPTLFVLPPGTSQGKLAPVDLHERIKLRRTQLALSHEKLAARISELEGLKKPLAWQTVQHWENTGSTPRTKRLQFVAKALELTQEQLLGFAPMPPAPIQDPASVAPASQPAPLVHETQTRYTAPPAWPFKVITSDQLTQLPSAQLAELERLIVDHLMHPMNVHWRRIALDLAAEYDRKNSDDHLSTFVRAVDLKARALRAAQAQEEAST